MRFRFESPSLEKMLIDLNESGTRATRDVREVVQNSAKKIRVDARARIEAQRNMGKYPNYLPKYSRTITFGIITVGDETEAVIGPDYGIRDMTQGFAGFIEYGTPTSPPFPHMNPALDEEDPHFMLALAEAVMRYLR